MFNISVNAPILTTGEYMQHERNRDIGQLIDSHQAITIANWWQSASGVGSIMAEFASGSEVDNELLLMDIDATLQIAYSENASESEIELLGRLMDWVESFSLDA